MKVLRTPDSRFANLADYPFPPHYHQITQQGAPELRLHYVDEGPSDAPPVLMLAIVLGYRICFPPEFLVVDPLKLFARV